MVTGHFTRVLILCCFSIVLAQAQIDLRNFSLDSFRLPPIDREALQGTGSLNGSHRGVNQPDLENQYAQSNFSQGLGLSYSRFINRSDLQATQFASINHQMSFRHFKSPSISGLETSNTDIDPQLVFTGTRRKYKGKSFFETSIYARSNYSHSKHETIDTGGTDIVKDNFYSVQIEPAIGFGKGRLEPVSDVAMAMFILKDAQDLGLDISSITTSEIYEFASLMAEVSNRRIFDSRRLRIQELRELYLFMQDKGWVLTDDPGYFTVLTDNWIYNNVFNRLSGKRWSYLFKPEFFYSVDRELFTLDKIERRELAASLIVDYRNYKQINVHRDHWHAHSIALRLADEGRDIIITSEFNRYTEFDFNNAIGRSWYPNNRTSIFMNLFANYTYYHPLDSYDFFEFEDQHVLQTGINAQTLYFLSYRTRLIANALVQYGYSNGGQLVDIINGFASSRTSTGFHASLNASIVVDIF